MLIQLASMGPDVDIFRRCPVMLEAARAGDSKVCQAAGRYFQRNVPQDLLSQQYNKGIGHSHVQRRLFLRAATIFPEPHH